MTKSSAKERLFAKRKDSVEKVIEKYANQDEQMRELDLIFEEAERKINEQLKKSNIDDGGVKVTPELVAKITGALKPITVQKQSKQFERVEYDLDGRGGIESFMDIMQRLIERSHRPEDLGDQRARVGPQASIFNRPPREAPQVEADPQSVTNLVEMGFPEERVK